VSRLVQHRDAITIAALILKLPLQRLLKAKSETHALPPGFKTLQFHSNLLLCRRKIYNTIRNNNINTVSATGNVQFLQV
jgi:hypothetical protein